MARADPRFARNDPEALSGATSASSQEGQRSWQTAPNHRCHEVIPKRDRKPPLTRVRSPGTLLMQRLRPELHRHAPTRQTAGPEGGGRAALCQRPLDEPHRQAARCLHTYHPGLAGAVRGSLRPEAGAGGPGSGDRARRDVALLEKKSEPLWVWKAWDRASGHLVDWECGGRDKVTCERLIKRLTHWRTRLYCADDYAVYDVLLPVGQLHAGKEETHGIERDNARQRHGDALAHAAVLCGRLRRLWRAPARR